jgi:hypothetical protein
MALGVDSMVVIKGAWCCARGVRVQQRTANLVVVISVMWGLSVGLPLKSVQCVSLFFFLSKGRGGGAIQRCEGLRILLGLGTP